MRSAQQKFSGFARLYPFVETKDGRIASTHKGPIDNDHQN